jgi:hypothetical protein
MFHGVVIISGLAFGLVLLLVVTGLPMWLFSSLVTLIYAFVVPLSSLAVTLLYGDAVAAERGADAMETVEA